MYCLKPAGDGTRCVRAEGHDNGCSSEWEVAAGTPVKHAKTGDAGVIVGLAKWQSHLPILLYRVRFAQLGDMRQVTVKLTRKSFTEV